MEKAEYENMAYMLKIIQDKDNEINALKMEIERLRSKTMYHREYSPPQLLLDELPESFTKDDVRVASEKLKYPIKTCEKYPTKLTNTGKLIHVSHNHYIKAK